MRLYYIYYYDGALEGRVTTLNTRIIYRWSTDLVVEGYQRKEAYYCRIFKIAKDLNCTLLMKLKICFITVYKKKGKSLKPSRLHTCKCNSQNYQSAFSWNIENNLRIYWVFISWFVKISFPGLRTDWLEVCIFVSAAWITSIIPLVPNILPLFLILAVGS